MSIPSITLDEYDLVALLIVVEDYLENLRTPELYPEYSSRNKAVLEKLEATFLILAGEEEPIPLFMTELEIIALDEALEAFVRVCEQSEVSQEKKQVALLCLNEFREELATMKLPAIH